MTVTALVSGGKDSIYSAYLAETQGWPVDELVTLRPADPQSLLFHTPNLHLVALQAGSWGKGHRSVVVGGYGEEAETIGLTTALRGSSGPVVAGAIGSSFQWARLNRVCFELGRPLYTPLWGKDPIRVVREEVAAGLDIRFVHLSAEGLPADLIGQALDAGMIARLEAIDRAGPGVHLAGEGGEYETLVLDAPFFAQRLELEETEVVRERDVTRLIVRKARLVRKAVH
ncbi:MAG: diphthine--ammonia ligase [Thermoplasmata archaeon]